MNIEFPEMTHTLTPQLYRIVNAVRRRMILARLAKNIALYVLGACIIAVPVIFFLLWRRGISLPIVAGLIATAGAVGIVAAIVRRPTPLQVAVLTDSQLGLKELLSSALLAKDVGIKDSLQSNLIAAAEQRCLSLSTESIRFARFAGRMWATVFLCLALVFTLAAMAPRGPNEKRITRALALNAATNSTISAAPLIDLSAASNGRLAASDSDEPNASHFGQNESAGSSEAASQPHGDANASGKPSSAAQGGGVGRTDNATASSLPPSSSDALASTPPGALASTGGNGADATDAVGDHNVRSGLNTTGSRPTQLVPPWQSASWHQSVQEASHQIISGHVPAAYGDLVKSYFQ